MKIAESLHSQNIQPGMFPIMIRRIKVNIYNYIMKWVTILMQSNTRVFQTIGG